MRRYARSWHMVSHDGRQRGACSDTQAVLAQGRATNAMGQQGCGRRTRLFDFVRLQEFRIVKRPALMGQTTSP